MLKPSPIKRYNVDPMHPHFVPELDFMINEGKLVVTVNDTPVDHVIGFSVPDGYVKRLASSDDLQRVAKLSDEAAYARVCRDGVRLKGQVRVYVNA